MRSKLFLIWAAARWAVAMLAVVLSLEAPGVARPKKPLRPMRAWEGVASWYGPRFHGRPTANGEVFNMYRFTAAHRTLPLGSVVRVVYPRTGRALVVRINDRGPYIQGREIDVSYQVAESLGFTERGLAQVRIELLEIPQRRWLERLVAD